jgi:hypothetical protein
MLREQDVTPVHAHTYLLESASRHPTGQPYPRPQLGSCHVRRRVPLGQADVVPRIEFCERRIRYILFKIPRRRLVDEAHTYLVAHANSGAHVTPPYIGGRFTARTGFMHCAEFDGFGAAEQFLSNSTRRLTEYCITGPFG